MHNNDVIYCPPRAKRVGGILKLFVLESTKNFVKIGSMSGTLGGTKNCVKIGSMSGTLGIDQKFRKNRFHVCYTRRYQKLVKIGSMSGTLGGTKNCLLFVLESTKNFVKYVKNLRV